MAFGKTIFVSWLHRGTESVSLLSIQHNDLHGTLLVV